MNVGKENQGNRPAEEIVRKVELLRHITQGKPFTIKELPKDILSRLDYTTRPGLHMLLRSLVTGESKCGRHLIKIGYGKYAWASSSNDEAVEPVAPHQLAKGFTSEEEAALDIIQEILIKKPDGFIRLVPAMVALEPDEFLDFVEKLESVKVVAKVGVNSNSDVGHVWGLVRDKFSDFCQVLQAVRSGQYEFPPEPSSLLESEPSVISSPPSGTEEQLEALVSAMAQELSKSEGNIKGLEQALALAKAEHSEKDYSYRIFRSELDRLRRLAKPPTR